jgi:hypothetical protein
MRLALIVATVCGAATICMPAMAFDSFIPLGMGYSTQGGNIAGLSSQEQQAINQADIYETDIYQRQLRARQTDSRMQRFLNDRNSNGTDYSVDY